MTSNSQNNAPSALRHGMWRDGIIRTTNTANLTCTHTLIENDRKREIRCEDLGTKVDALQDLSKGMAMRTMEKSKTMMFHEFLQKKQ
jgi:hypothetical protein